MIRPVVKNDVEKFDRYLLDLKKQMGRKVSWQKLIKSEAGSILAKCAQWTQRANKAYIGKKYTIKARTQKSMPEGSERKKDSKGRFKKEGRVKGSKTPQNEELVPYVKVDGKTYWTGNYYPDPIFEKIKSRLDKKRDKALARVFSGKATWLLAAKKCGAPTKNFPAMASLQKAISAQSGSYSRDSTENGTEVFKLFKYHIEVFNAARCALNRAAGGEKALARAMKGRTNFMKTNIKKGVFRSAAAMADKYPGVEVRDK